MDAQVLALIIWVLQLTVQGSGAGLHSARLVVGGEVAMSPVVAPPSPLDMASGGSPVQTVQTTLHELAAAAPQTSGSQHDVPDLPDPVHVQLPSRHWKSRRQTLAPPSVPLPPPELQAEKDRPATRQNRNQMIPRVLFMAVRVARDAARGRKSCIQRLTLAHPPPTCSPESRLRTVGGFSSPAAAGKRR